MELGRDLTKTWAVVDMDMFFAAVEIRDAPHLADKPVAVGGMGMISTANYVARTYGVRRREEKGREGKRREENLFYGNLKCVLLSGCIAMEASCRGDALL